MLLGLFAVGFFITVIQIIRIQFMKGLANPLNSLFKQKRNSSKATPESSWGDNTTPSNARHSCRIVPQRIPSKDDLFDSGGCDTNRIMNMHSREPILPPRNRQIIKETDIVVVNQLAPAYLAYHDAGIGKTRIGDYECWARVSEGSVSP